MYHPGDRLKSKKKVTSTHSAEEGKDFMQNGLSEKTETNILYERMGRALSYQLFRIYSK